MTAPLAWSPSWPVFVRRIAVNGALTFAVFVLLVYFSGYTRDYTGGRFILFTTGLPLVMTLILMLDDLMRWRRVRDEQWDVAEGQLTHDGPDGLATIPLAEIAEVQKRLGGAVVIRLTSGQRVLMRYLEDPTEAAATLNAALPQ